VTNLLDLPENPSLVEQEQCPTAPLEIFEGPSLEPLLLGLIVSFFYSFLVF